MESADIVETSQVIKKILESAKSASKLIVECSPDLDIKVKSIASLAEYTIQEGLEKVIVCTHHALTADRITKHLNGLIKVKGVCLSSKKAYCLKKPMCFGTESEIQAKCQNYCARGNCEFRLSTPPEISKILSLTEIKTFCEDSGVCPYYYTQSQISSAKIIICSQSYFFRKGMSLLSNFLPKSIIVFEDAFNLDTCIIDYLSINLNLKILSSALRGVEELGDKIKEIFEQDFVDYEKYYIDCKEGKLKAYADSEYLMRDVVCNDEVLNSPVPGNIRKPSHFLKCIKQIIVYLRMSLRGKEATIQSSYGFLYKLCSNFLIRLDSLKYASLLFASLCTFTKIPLSENLMSLNFVCDFCSLSSIYPELYSFIFEPYPESVKILNPVIQLSYQNPGFFLKNFLSKSYSSIFFTSSCIPEDIYKTLLGLDCEVLNTTYKPNICPMILTKGSDQLFLTTKFEEKVDDGIMRNYGEVLLELSDEVPDGIVVFFPELSVLENYILKWNESLLLFRLLEKKLVFVETSGNEYKILKNFNRACECGRGAVLLAVSRGKIANDLHLYSEHIKCSLTFGVPQASILSRVLKSRLAYMKERLGIDESEYLNFDAMRQAVFCLSQSIRGNVKNAIIIFADKRFDSQAKKNKIPEWISGGFKSYTNVSTDVAKTLSFKFLKYSQR